jgi:signal peptidase I
MTNPYDPPAPEPARVPRTGIDRGPALVPREEKNAPRWMAVLVTFLSANHFWGLGYLVLRRGRAAISWSLIGLVLTVLMAVAVRLGVAALYFLTVLLALLGWVAAMVQLGRMRAVGIHMTKSSATALAIGALVFGVAASSASRRWVTSSYQVPAASMVPTVLPGDHFMAAKGSTAGRGDVIVFQYPLDPDIEYVKRVMALGGDTIEVREDVVMVNGQGLPQKPLTDRCGADERSAGAPVGCVVLEEQNGVRRYRIQHDGPAVSYGPFTVPAGHIFVMGDNRHNSND